MAKKLSTGLIIVYGYEVSKFGGRGSPTWPPRYANAARS